MEELGRLFPSLLPFLVLGVPAIVYLFRLFVDEKEKRITDIKSLSIDFQKTLKEMEHNHAANDGKLLEAINGVKSIADRLLDRSKDV